MFNNISHDKSKDVSLISKPPEIKPLLQTQSVVNGSEHSNSAYISRSSVEKILNQQRKVSLTLMQPYDVTRGGVLTPGLFWFCAGLSGVSDS